MINILVAHRRELESELRERVQAFFEANDALPESVSIEMKLTGQGDENRLPTIHILVKEACTDKTLAMT